MGVLTTDEYYGKQKSSAGSPADDSSPAAADSVKPKEKKERAMKKYILMMFAAAPMGKSIAAFFHEGNEVQVALFNGKTKVKADDLERIKMLQLAGFEEFVGDEVDDDEVDDEKVDDEKVDAEKEKKGIKKTIKDIVKKKKDEQGPAMLYVFAHPDNTEQSGVNGEAVLSDGRAVDVVNGILRVDNIDDAEFLKSAGYIFIREEEVKDND